MPLTQDEKIGQIETYQKVFTEEFIAEFLYLLDVAADRTEGRLSFSAQLWEHFKNVVKDLPVPGINTASEFLTAAFGAAFNAITSVKVGHVIKGGEFVVSQLIEEDHAFNVAQSHVDREALRWVIDYVARRAAERYEFFLTCRISTVEGKAVIPFARTGVLRALEYLTRTKPQDLLDSETLLKALIEGRSGRFITAWTNQSLDSQNEDLFDDLTAEGAYARSAMAQFKGRQAFTLWGKTKAGVLKQIKNWFRGKGKSAKDQFGYVHYLDREDSKKDPKYGYLTLASDKSRNAYAFDRYLIERHSIEFKEEWEDFVENRHYQRCTLQDVKNYISQLKHGRFKRFKDFIAQTLDTTVVPVLDGVSLEDLRTLRGCDFSGTDMNHVTITGDLTDTRFDDAYLFGAKFYNVKILDSQYPPSFKRAVMPFADLSKNVKLPGADFTQAVLAFANLETANIADILHVGTLWHKANLKNANYASDLEKARAEQMKKMAGLQEAQSRQLRDLGKKYKKLTTQNEALKEQLGWLNDELAAESKGWRAECEKLALSQQDQMRQYLQYQQRLEELEIWGSSSEKEVETLKNAIQSVNDNIAAQKEKFNESLGKISSDLDAKLGDYQDQLDEVKGTLGSFEQTMLDCYDELSQKYELLSSRVGHLEEELAAVVSRVDDHDRQLADIRATLAAEGIQAVLTDFQCNNISRYCKRYLVIQYHQQAIFSQDEDLLHGRLITDEGVFIDNNLYRLTDTEIASPVYGASESQDKSRLHVAATELFDYQFDMGADKRKDIFLYGDTGSGKTAICKYYAAKWASQSDDQHSWVFYLPLANLVSHNGTLSSFIYEHFFKFVHPNIKETHIERMLGIAGYTDMLRGQSNEQPKEDQPQIMLILDGLDDLSDRADLLQSLNQVLAARQCHVMLTASSQSFLKRLPGWKPDSDAIFRCEGFEPKDIQRYVETRSGRSDIFRRQATNLSSIAKMPVNISMLCMIDESTNLDLAHLTSSPASLYSLLVDALHTQRIQQGMQQDGKKAWREQWDLLKGKTQEKVKKAEVNFLGELAFKAILQDSSKIGRKADYIPARIRFFDSFGAKSTLYLSQVVFKNNPYLSIHKFGIHIVGTYYTFKFAGLREYFAATYLQGALKLGKSEDGRKLAEKFIQEHKYNPKYEEVFRILLSLLAANEKEIEDPFSDSEPSKGISSLSNFVDLVFEEKPVTLSDELYYRLYIILLEASSGLKRHDRLQKNFDKLKNYVSNLISLEPTSKRKAQVLSLLQSASQIIPELSTDIYQSAFKVLRDKIIKEPKPELTEEEKKSINQFLNFPWVLLPLSSLQEIAKEWLIVFYQAAYDMDVKGGLPRLHVLMREAEFPWDSLSIEMIEQVKQDVLRYADDVNMFAYQRTAMIVFEQLNWCSIEAPQIVELFLSLLKSSALAVDRIKMSPQPQKEYTVPESYNKHIADYVRAFSWRPVDMALFKEVVSFCLKKLDANRQSDDYFMLPVLVSFLKADLSVDQRSHLVKETCERLLGRALGDAGPALAADGNVGEIPSSIFKTNELIALLAKDLNEPSLNDVLRTIINAQISAEDDAASLSQIVVCLENYPASLLSQENVTYIFSLISRDDIKKEVEQLNSNSYTKDLVKLLEKFQASRPDDVSRVAKDFLTIVVELSRKEAENNRSFNVSRGHHRFISKFLLPDDVTGIAESIIAASSDYVAYDLQEVFKHLPLDDQQGINLLQSEQVQEVKRSILSGELDFKAYQKAFYILKLFFDEFRENSEKIADQLFSYIENPQENYDALSVMLTYTLPFCSKEYIYQKSKALLISVNATTKSDADKDDSGAVAAGAPGVGANDKKLEALKKSLGLFKLFPQDRRLSDVLLNLSSHALSASAYVLLLDELKWGSLNAYDLYRLVSNLLVKINVSLNGGVGNNELLPLLELLNNLPIENLEPHQLASLSNEIFSSKKLLAKMECAQYYPQLVPIIRKLPVSLDNVLNMAALSEELKHDDLDILYQNREILFQSLGSKDNERVNVLVLNDVLVSIIRICDKFSISFWFNGGNLFYIDMGVQYRVKCQIKDEDVLLISKGFSECRESRLKSLDKSKALKDRHLGDDAGEAGETASSSGSGSSPSFFGQPSSSDSANSSAPVGSSMVPGITSSEDG